MKRILLFLVGLTCVFCASSALAQIFNTQMYFNGGYQGNVWSGEGESVATGFYDGSINGVNVGPGQTSPGFICDDYYDNITSGEHWTATGYQVSSLNVGNIGSDTLFGNANWSNVVSTWTGAQGAVFGYEALAYLANMMFTTNPSSAMQSSISQAMWYLTSVATGHGWSLGSLDPGAQSLVAYVTTHSLAGLSSYSGLFLYTEPFNPTGPQEMWGQIDILTVPEGGSALAYLLIATLACMGAVRQARRMTGARSA